MIDEIRAYFKTVMKSVDTDYKEHGNPFITSNISETMMDHTYAIQIGSTSNLSQEDNFSQDVVDVLIKIIDKGHNCTMDKYTALYCKAHEIRLAACDRATALSNDNQFIDNVQLISILPSPLDGNNNGFMMDIQFTVYTSVKLI